MKSTSQIYDKVTQFVQMIFFGSSRYWKIHEDSHFSSKHAQTRFLFGTSLGHTKLQICFSHSEGGSTKKVMFLCTVFDSWIIIVQVPCAYTNHSTRNSRLVSKMTFRKEVTPLQCGYLGDLLGYLIFNFRQICVPQSNFALILWCLSKRKRATIHAPPKTIKHLHHPTSTSK